MEQTSYSEIIELVLAILKSYEIDNIFDKYDEDGVLTMLLPYFKFASGELSIRNSSINTGRDDELLMFEDKLTDAQQLIFARFVLIGYLTKDTCDILQLRIHLQDGDFKTHAVKNNLDAKLNLLTILKEEVGWNVNKIGYNETNVWG